jgi:enoyl-CoA hydratase
MPSSRATRAATKAAVLRPAPLLGRIAAGAPLVARWHKKFVRRLLDPAPLTDAELEDNYTCFATEDFQTGYRSFLEKKKPAFKGR